MLLCCIYYLHVSRYFYDIYLYSFRCFTFFIINFYLRIHFTSPADEFPYENLRCFIFKWAICTKRSHVIRRHVGGQTNRLLHVTMGKNGCRLWPGKLNISGFLAISGFVSKQWVTCRHLWCVLVSKILLKIVHLFIALKKSISMLRSLQQFEHSSSLFKFANLWPLLSFHWPFSLSKGCKYFFLFNLNYRLTVTGGMDRPKSNQLLFSLNFSNID